MDQEATCFGTGVPGWQASCIMELPAAPSIEIEAVETADAFPLELLSNRERDVVKLVLEGESDVEVAVCLGISLRTMRDRLCRAFRKLGVRNRKNLIVVLMFAEPRATVTAKPFNQEKTMNGHFNCLERPAPSRVASGSASPPPNTLAGMKHPAML
jgi:DNA-binding CsgD family transcriptional regulator